MDPDFLRSLVESMSLVRLSVKKAAYADLSRAAYRKSGAILGRDPRDEPAPQGRLKITQDAILGTSNSENGLFAIRGGQPLRHPVVNRCYVAT
jgi:hypothetical protein